MNRVRIRFSVSVGKLLCTRICASLGCNCHGPISTRAPSPLATLQQQQEHPGAGSH